MGREFAAPVLHSSKAGYNSYFLDIFTGFSRVLDIFHGSSICFVRNPLSVLSQVTLVQTRGQRGPEERPWVDEEALISAVETVLGQQGGCLPMQQVTEGARAHGYSLSF